MTCFSWAMFQFIKNNISAVGNTFGAYRIYFQFLSKPKLDPFDSTRTYELTSLTSNWLYFIIANTLNEVFLCRFTVCK